MPAPKLTPRELAAIVKQRISSSLGFEGDTLSSDRNKALKYYRGEALGNEVEGRSQVVARDVSEAIDSLMPPLMKVFSAGERTVMFEPQSPEDEEAAKQATDYCNWIFNQQNDGFRILYTCIKDGLLFKTGVACVWWDDTPETTSEKYQGLTDAQFAMLEADEAIEITAHTKRTETPEPVEIAPGQMLEVPPVTFHDVEITKTLRTGKVCIAAVPPEEFLIERDAVDVETANFLGRWYETTVSVLAGKFPDKREVIERASGWTEDDLTGERAERFRDELPTSDDPMAYDPASRPVKTFDGFMRIDWDNDGEAELRHIVTVGDSEHEILFNERVDDNDFAAFSPTLMPHKFHGMSTADQTMDLQQWKTAVIRGINDNIYLTNSPMNFVTGEVEFEQLLSPKPGAVVRGKQGATVTPLVVPFMAKDAFQLIEYIDTEREQRTGVTRYSQGLDSDALNKTARGITIIQDAAQQRQELIARVIAEVFMKRLFRLILRAVTQYQNRKQVIRLRNQWVEMDPREWKNNYDMTVTVGLGTGNRDQQVMQLSNLLRIHGETIALLGGQMPPWLTPKNIYNTEAKLIEASGLKSPEPYLTDPDTVPPQPPQPDPKMLELQGKMQMEAQKHQAEMQAKAADFELEKRKAEQELYIKQQEWELKKQEMLLSLEVEKTKAGIEIEKANIDMQLKAAGQAQDLEAKRTGAQMDLEHRKEQHGIEIERAKLKGADKNGTKVVIGENDSVTRNVEKMGERSEKAIEANTKAIETLAKIVQEMARPKKVKKNKDGEWVQTYA